MSSYVCEGCFGMDSSDASTRVRDFGVWVGESFCQQQAVFLLLFLTGL